MTFKIDTLARKIGLGYVLIILILAAAVLVTIWQVREIKAVSVRLIELRMPTARASLETLNSLNQAVASQRGWILLFQARFKEERQIAWDEIESILARLDHLSTNWSNPENVERLTKLRPLFREVRKIQDRIEELSVLNGDSARSLLKEESIVLSLEIKEILTEMVEDQETLMRTDFGNINDRISLLGKIEWLLLGGGILLSVLVLLSVTRSIAQPIANAIEVARDVGSGNLEANINVGGFREVENLGDALLKMRDGLKMKTEETQLFNWLTTGQNRLNETMRGDKEMKHLADDVVRFMAMYTGASVGALYVLDDQSQKLKLAGKYAFSNGQAQETFDFNEGLIGQAARNQEWISLGEMDEKHIRVKSSIAEAPPKNLVVVPFSFEGGTLGVIELGKLEDFDDSHRTFIASSMESIGISFNSAMARSKIQELLQETQQQSEELQQQQEELEQTNEELEEQAHNLKQQQEELQVSNEELEEQSRLVEEKNNDLEKARTEIERKANQLELTSKYKSEFLANMSHELRTPLNSLLILSNDLADNKEGNLDQEQVECMKIIAKSGKTLLSLINEILDLSKIESGKIELDVKDVSIERVKDNIYRDFHRLAEKKGLGFEVTIDETLPKSIRTDKLRLDQILKNLISNALKFTHQGKVGVDFQRDVGGLSIAVRDTGIGIAKDKQELVFEAFKQAEGGTSRKYGGTGLGLSISRELAKLLDGRILLESKLGEGSIFNLILPLKMADKAQGVIRPNNPPSEFVPVNDDAGSSGILVADQKAIADQRNEISETDKSILIIEDDPDFAGLVARQANANGFKFISASSGHGGLLMASQHKPNAIILDIGLPDIDGYRVLKELKGNQELRHIPVHIISGMEKDFDPIKYGAMEHLTKPITKAQLNKAFQRMENYIHRKMKNLLIVEDDENMRISIKKLIGNGDVRCYEAANAKEAIQKISAYPIDCIVLDIGLPDTNGLDLVKKLRQENKRETIPVIIYTGRELTKEEAEELRQYAETIIVKGEKSDERLLDETALFLHRTVKDLPREKQDMISSVYDKEGVFQDKKVLLVDDDMRNAFALTRLLKEKGFEIIKADNGLTALKELEENPGIDIVLMDIMMPEMDGYQCMRKIRDQSRFKRLPIIALTAKAMKEDRKKCTDAGANDYIAKPVDIERLFSLMRIWLSR